MTKQKNTYADAGVNLEAADATKNKIKEIVKSTFSKNVLTDVGLFGGLFDLDKDKYKDPVLVSSADGVGTKLKVAIMSGKHDTVGQCLVNHCVDDILSQGAKPLFFLDYIATGKLEPGVVASVVEGLAKACGENGCALIGGETAEMPDFYSEGEYDLAGFIVGIVEKDKIIDGSKLGEGDVILGLPSNGLHTNGYSLARKIFFSDLGMDVDTYIEEVGKTAGEVLLNTHISYLKPVSPLLDNDLITGVAHITGGGLPGNVNRIVPDGMSAHIDTNAWDVPPIFKFMAEKGNVEIEEMFRVFNMGIGLVLFVSKDKLSEAIDILKTNKQDFYTIGELKQGEEKVVLEGI